MSGCWERSPLDVLIATPVSGHDVVPYEWHDSFLNSWLNLPKGLKVARVRLPEPCIDIVRDKAVNIALQNGALWLFFVDSDILMPPDTLTRLLAHRRPITAGLYVRRHNPPFNEMLLFRKDGLPGLRPIMDGEYVDGSLVECDAVGTGCVLIHTSVFAKVKPFKLSIDDQECRAPWFLWTESRLNPGMSEDFAFFSRASQQGVRCVCDTSIKLKHVGPVKFVPSGNNQLQIEFIGG